MWYILVGPPYRANIEKRAFQKICENLKKRCFLVDKARIVVIKFDKAKKGEKL